MFTFIAFRSGYIDLFCFPVYVFLLFEINANENSYKILFFKDSFHWADPKSVGLGPA